MRIRREFVAIFCVIAFLISDPEVARACMIGENAYMTWDTSSKIDLFAGMDASKVHVIYELNGGMNNRKNVSSFQAEDLPFTFAVPVKEGYNFAGWYSDISYHHKVTELNEKNAQNMVLFAKWTKVIDSNYNVEMYSYQTSSLSKGSCKELKDCTYGFLQDVAIPGMPSTRENDYREQLISSGSQCPQGICFTPDYLLVTSYTEKADVLGSLMVFDVKTGEYLVTLGMKSKSHLGGITFDGENVWVCHSNSNTLERISYEFIQKIAQAKPECLIDASALSDEYKIANTPSCITFYGDRLWVATHTKYLNSKMVSYSYDKETDSLTSLSTYKIPSKVQGVAFDSNGTVYLSTSYGREKSSYLKVYDSLLQMSKKPNNPEQKVEMPPCSEELALVDGNLYVLFESAGEKYLEGTDGNGKSISPIDKVLTVTVASIF